MTNVNRSAAAPLVPVLLAVSGLLVPILYFGAQLLAAPFYSEFDLLRTTASDLGSERSTRPGIANTAALLGSLVTFVTAVGFGWQLSRRVPMLLVGLVVVALVLTALMKLYAWQHPLPDPLHGRNPFSAASIALPLVLPLVTWRVLSRGVRTYLLVNLALYAALFAMFSGLYPGPTQLYPGLMQRLLAVTTFVPVGVLGVALSGLPLLSGRSQRRPGDSPS